MVVYLFKDHPWWTAGVAAVSAVVAWLSGLGVPWHIWFCLAVIPVCIFMGIRQTWFPHGFRKQKKQSVRSGKRPHVVPVESGWDERRYSGLFFKNDGDVPAYSVVVEPLQLGEVTVEFTGSETTYLEPGKSFFLYPENCPPSVVLLNTPSGNSVFNLIRSWQSGIDDPKAEAKGCVRYKDRDGSEYEISYRIRRDVLNRKSGLAIEVELD